MKKLMYAVSFILLGGIMMVSCKKDSIQPTNVAGTQVATENLLVADGKGQENFSMDKNGNAQFDSEFQLGNEGRFLVFRSEKGYNKAVDNPSDEVRENLRRRVSSFGFESWKDLAKNDADPSNDELISDEYFGGILSRDRTIQIENYIYRINPQNEEVLALNVKDRMYYTDLIESPNSNKIIHFGMEANVLELIKGNLSGVNNGDVIERIGCSEGCSGGSNVYTDRYSIPVISGEAYFEGRAEYNRYGIYFSLYGRVTSVRGGGLARIYVQCENIWYKPKCRDAQGPYNEQWYQSNSTYSDYQKKQSYSGSRCLKGYHFKMRGRCEVSGYPQGTNPYTTYFTNWIEIKRNSPWG